MTHLPMKYLHDKDSAGGFDLLEDGMGTRSDADRLEREMGQQNLGLNPMLGGAAMTETMWRCDQVRAGQLYNRVVFNTREEAEEFMVRMRQMEPDQAITMEAVDARQVWN